MHEKNERSLRRRIATEVSNVLQLNGHVDLDDAWNKDPNPTKIVRSALRAAPSLGELLKRYPDIDDVNIRAVLAARAAMCELMINGVRELVANDVADQIMAATSSRAA
jgi:hypothetical protein